MSSFKEKVSNNKNEIIKVFIAIMIPIIGVTLMLAINGVNIFELSIINEQCNDELFYYKQIEGILSYGHPKGYWGFNESHAMYGNFAAWNPTILLPQLLFARIFGLSDISPFFVNIFVFSVASAIFTIMTKPSIKQLAMVGLTFLSYSMATRYLLSVMPESNVAALFFIYCSLLYNYRKTGSNKVIMASYVILALLTMMRGYYAVFSLLSIALFVEKRDKKKVVAQIIITIVSAIIFLLVNKYFTAAYFEPIVHFDWIKDPSLILIYINSGINTTIYFIKEALKFNAMRGSFYICYLVLGIILLVKTLKERKLVHVGMMVCWVILMLAMWLIYTPVEGSRHLMDIELVGILFLPLLINKIWLEAAIIVISVLLTWCSKDTFYTDLPIRDNGFIEEINSQELHEKMPLSENPWDNTVIWVYSLNHNELYNLPVGFGINCCLEEYIINNWGRLQARYIAITKGSDIESAIDFSTYDVVAEYGNIIIYQLR